MLTYFTTWNLLLLSSGRLRRNHSNALLSLSASVSLGGLCMLTHTLLFCKKEKVLWKEYSVSRRRYLVLEVLIHQLPFLFILKYVKRTGESWKALVPVSVYCLIVKNPYRLGGVKVKNLHGLLLIMSMCPLVNHLLKRKVL